MPHILHTKSQSKPGPARWLLFGVRLLLTVLAAAFALSYRQAFLEPEFPGLAGFVPVNHTAPLVVDEPFVFHLQPTGRTAHQLRLLVVPPAENEIQPITLTLTCADSSTPVLERQLTREELLSGDYITLSLPNDFVQGKPCTVQLTTTETDPLRAVSLPFGTAQQSDVTSWYRGEVPQLDAPSLMLVYTVPRRLAILVGALLFCAALMALAWPALSRRLPTGVSLVLDRCLQLGYPLAMPVLTLWCIETLQFGNLLSLGPRAIVGNLALLYGMTVVLLALTRRPLCAASLASLISLGFGTVNHYLLLFRGTTLLPWDILGAATAAKVAAGYTFEVDHSVVCAVLAAALTLCAAVLDRPLPRPRRCALRLAAGAAALTLGAAVVWVPIAKPHLFGAQLDLYRQQLAARNQNGFVLNFSLNLPLLAHTKPKGYDPDSLTGYIPDQLPQTPAQNIALTEKQQPNLLFVMNESFCDPRTLFAVNESESPLLPGLDALKTDPAAHVGQLGISIFGGGTSCTEYEVISGFSIRNDSASFAPYMVYFKENTPTIAWHLRQYGYQTAGLHLANSDNWYRGDAYPTAGFARQVFLDESTGRVQDSAGLLNDRVLTAADMIRLFAADRVNYELLLQMMRQSNEPLFALNVTIQNHGGYGDEEQVFAPATDPWCNYLTLLHSSDAQLTEFLQQLQQFDEPTVVVFFGDHWTYYDDGRLAQIGLDVNALTDEQQINYRTTPYMVWSNCGYDFSQLPGQTSAPYLGAQVLHQLGLPLNSWQSFLVDGAAHFPLYTFYLAQGSDAAALADYAYRYTCLQYNALNDADHYASALFGQLP